MAVITVHQSTPGDDFELLVEKYNNLVTKFNQLLAKLDADAGVADTNYASTLGGHDTIQLGY